MELAYEGSIKKNNFGLARLKLTANLVLYQGRHAVSLYWDKDEHAPVAEIDSSKIRISCRNTLSDLCLRNDFMVKIASDNLSTTL